jgi:hypothetical protein
VTTKLTALPWAKARGKRDLARAKSGAFSAGGGESRAGQTSTKSGKLPRRPRLLTSASPVRVLPGELENRPSESEGLLVYTERRGESRLGVWRFPVVFAPSVHRRIVFSGAGESRTGAGFRQVAALWLTDSLALCSLATRWLTAPRPQITHQVHPCLL